MKKFLMACAFAMGVLITGQNAACAEDVWVASDSHTDFYVMTETLTLDTMAHVNIKFVDHNQRVQILPYDFTFSNGGEWRMSGTTNFYLVSEASPWVQNAYHEVEHLLRDE